MIIEVPTPNAVPQKCSRPIAQRVILFWLTLVLSFAADASETQSTFKVTSPPAAMKLDAFYKKYVNANGYPIVSSEKVADHALLEAAYLVELLLHQRPDVRDAMVRSGSRMTVIAHSEFTTDIPEHRHLTPKDYWDAEHPICSPAATGGSASCSQPPAPGAIGPLPMISLV